MGMKSVRSERYSILSGEQTIYAPLNKAYRRFKGPI